MKRIVLAAAIAASTLAAVIPAHAATSLTPQFDVAINLTTGCVITAAPGSVSFTYTFNSGSAVGLDSNGSYSVKCSKNLTYTMALDAGGSYTDNATDLAYTLSLSAAGGTGSGAAQPYTITGNMGAGQSGTCTGSVASCDNSGSTNKTRTLTVTY